MFSVKSDVGSFPITKRAVEIRVGWNVGCLNTAGAVARIAGVTPPETATVTLGRL